MAKISTDTIEEINARIDLVSLVEQYTHLEKRGYDWWGCCPFHNEKTASFHVVPDKKMYYCFGCGAGGSTIKFLMEMEKLSFNEAVENLAAKAGIAVSYVDGSIPMPASNFKDELLELYSRVAGTFRFFLTHSEEGEAARTYLKQRGLTDSIMSAFNIGYAPANRRWLYAFLRKKGYSDNFLSQSGLFSKKNVKISFFSDRIMYPIANRHGQVIAFGGRILKGDGPKYLNTSGIIHYKKGETLFAFSQALPHIRKEKTVIFCEGYMDVIAFHQAGITNAVAPLGTALTDEQVKLVHSFADTVILAFDADAAGEKAAFKAILMCRKHRLHVKVFLPEGEKDPADILLKKGYKQLFFCLESAMIDADYLIKIALHRFDIVTPEGKALAAAFLFPFVEVLESDIQKESTLNTVSAAFCISPKALFADYRQYRNHKKMPSYKSDVLPAERGVLKMNAELRVVLAAVTNPRLFEKMRVQLSSDDFEDCYAKDLFIVLEECYRADVNTYDNLLSCCPSEILRNTVSSAVITGEFSENANRLVDDGIIHIKRNALNRKKDIILRKLQMLRGMHSVDEVEQMNALLSEKLHIDKMLAQLKEMA